MVACAGYAPDDILTNTALAERVDTTDEWIAARTGIRERRIARSDQATSDLAVQAARRVLDRAGVEPGALDVVIVGHALPTTSFRAPRRLSARTSASAPDRLILSMRVRAGSMDSPRAVDSLRRASPKTSSSSEPRPCLGSRTGATGRPAYFLGTGQAVPSSRQAQRRMGTAFWPLILEPSPTGRAWSWALGAVASRQTRAMRTVRRATSR